MNPAVPTNFVMMVRNQTIEVAPMSVITIHKTDTPVGGHDLKGGSMCAKIPNEEEIRQWHIDYWQSQVNSCLLSLEDNGFYHDAVKTLDSLLNPTIDFQI